MSDSRWSDPREHDPRDRGDEWPRVYDPRDRDERDPRDALMRDLDLPRSDARELVVDRDLGPSFGPFRFLASSEASSGPAATAPLGPFDGIVGASERDDPT